jgi:mono/diheme cytochrome c family protein
MTAEMVTQGKQIFGGAGICFTCHGQGGEGMPNLGANLTDSQWLHSDGSYEGIIATITAGVPADKSTSGSPMVARGGTNLPDDQIAAVAAYVWTLSR